MKKMIRVAGVSLLSLLLAATAGAKAKPEKDNTANKTGPAKSQVTSVPEPATLGLLGAGALAFGVSRLVLRRKK